MNEFRYVGNELHAFAQAGNWKAYVARQVRPFLGRDVLEVGAGIGTTTAALWTTSQRRWTALEPDAGLAAQTEAAVRQGKLPANCDVRVGDITRLGTSEVFDSVLYVDVLEHVEDDVTEVTRAIDRLRPGGHLVVLAPAHQRLYSPFDRAIGHYRRYDAGTLTSMVPPRAKLVRLRYLDSVGMLASYANAVLLRQEIPTRSQIAVWDGLMVPASRVLDLCLGFRVGKSILAVWRA